LKNLYEGVKNLKFLSHLQLNIALTEKAGKAKEVLSRLPNVKVDFYIV